MPLSFCFFQSIINSQNAQIMKMHEYLVKEEVKNPSSNVAAGASLRACLDVLIEPYIVRLY